MPISKGDRVRHVGSHTNKRFAEAVGIGTVVSVFARRVRVHWDNVRKARNYKEENLIKQ